MYVPFNQLSENSSVWIYLPDRELSNSEKDYIAQKLEDFCNDWTAHNNSLKASYSFFYGHVIVLAVDNGHHHASGCSIDKSVKVMKELESALTVGFFNRLLIPVVKNNRLATHTPASVKEAIARGEVLETDPILDLSITTLKQFQQNPTQVISNSWAKKFFQQATQPKEILSSN